MYHTVILAGGIGKRLYPENRSANPKQFLVFENDRTLLENSVERTLPLVPLERTWILAEQKMTERIRSLLPQLPEQQILAEPVRRNTAPAIGLAAAKILETAPDAVLFVLPSDHIIKPVEVFRQTLLDAAALVEQKPEMLVTLGVKPAFPATAYGYIHKGDAIQSATAEAYIAKRFCEKPPLEKAVEYIQSGQYFWNAGIFIFKAQTIWNLLHRYEPELGIHLDRIRASFGTENEHTVTSECFTAMKNISIDYAVMERADTIGVVPATFDWCDIGTWSALDNLYANQRDAAGNICMNAQVAAVQSSNCTVRSSDSKRLFALVGITDTVIVHTDDTTLIMKKNHDELLRELDDNHS
jgi:mannose-1-phosphate guanylyltransferase